MSALFLVSFKYSDQQLSLPLAPVSMYSYCLPNPRYFCKFHCSLNCAVVNYLVNRTAYDETTAWCYVPHRLKPLSF